MVASSLLLCLLSAAHAFQGLQGVAVQSVRSPDSTVDLGEWIQTKTPHRKLLVFGTYAADFNAVEYAQRLRFYLPKLADEKNVRQCAFILNCRPEAARKLAALTDLPEQVELLVDNEGVAGRKFGVGLGWLPEEKEINPFLKLFGMLWGLGAWATLPAVIGGYIGNPFTPQPWIQDALQVGQSQGRWPNNALEIQSDGSVVNKFDELPVVGEWKRRPLELATLRLQSMLGISIKHWKELAPDQDALDAGVLTQLGGCLVVDGNGATLFSWKDPGICAVANFEKMMEML